MGKRGSTVCARLCGANLFVTDGRELQGGCNALKERRANLPHRRRGFAGRDGLAGHGHLRTFRRALRRRGARNLPRPPRELHLPAKNLVHSFIIDEPPSSSRPAQRRRRKRPSSLSRAGPRLTPPRKGRPSSRCTRRRRGAPPSSEALVAICCPQLQTSISSALRPSISAPPRRIQHNWRCSHRRASKVHRWNCATQPPAAGRTVSAPHAAALTTPRAPHPPALAMAHRNGSSPAKRIEDGHPV